MARVGWHPRRFWPLETSCTPASLQERKQWTGQVGRQLSPCPGAPGSCDARSPGCCCLHTPSPRGSVPGGWSSASSWPPGSFSVMAFRAPGEVSSGGEVGSEAPSLHWGLGLSPEGRGRALSPRDNRKGQGALLGAKPPLPGDPGDPERAPLTPPEMLPPPGSHCRAEQASLLVQIPVSLVESPKCQSCCGCWGPSPVPRGPLAVVIHEAPVLVTLRSGSALVMAVGPPPQRWAGPTGSCAPCPAPGRPVDVCPVPAGSRV